MHRWWLFALLALALMLGIGRVAAGVYADWTWYAALGALPLYRSRLVHELALRGGGALLGFVLAFVNLYAVRRSIVSLVLPRRIANLDFGEAVPGRFLTAIVTAMAFALGALLALPTGEWTTLALARIGGEFGERDPYLGLDIGFLVFRLPLERLLHDWSAMALLTVSTTVVLLYALTPSLRWSGGRLLVSTYVRRHFGVLGSLALLVLAWSYRLDGLSLTADASGPGELFGAFELDVAVPLLATLSIAAITASFVVLWAAWHGHVRLAAVVALVLLLAGPLLRGGLPTISRWSLTERDVVESERPFRTIRTLFTRRAFGVDELGEAGSAPLAVLSRVAAARGVSSWDPAAISRAIEEESRRDSVAGLAWLISPGGLVAAAVRRPDAAEGTWTATMLDVTTADERGLLLPSLLGPAVRRQGLVSVLVYEGAPRYAVLSDTTGHVAAPAFAALTERLAHSWRLQAPQLLAREVPALRPRILFRRGVRERLEALTPFFVVGPSILPVVRGDSLYWVAELFSTSDAYPLAEPLVFAGELRRYVRHVATAVVHAHTGRVTILADRRGDAFLRAWRRAFPWLFAQSGELSPDLAALRPPALDWASIQATALARTGIRGDTLSPHGVARTDDADADLAVGAPPLLALQGDRGPLGWALPLVDPLDRVVGAVLAVGGDAPRSEWRRAALPMRWSTVLDLLQRAADSAGFGRQRPHARRGHVQVVPMADGLTFGQSFYEWPPDAPPSLAGVAVLERSRARTGATLADALGLAGGGRASSVAPLRARVIGLYQQMSDALRRGDWVAFGDAFSALGMLLRTVPR